MIARIYASCRRSISVQIQESCHAAIDYGLRTFCRAEVARQRGHGEAGWHETCFDEVAMCREKVKRNPRHGPMLAIVDEHAKLEYAGVFLTKHDERLVPMEAINDRCPF
jgi:hypothetical protein